MMTTTITLMAPMATHHSTAPSHGRQAPCICELPANAPADMPLECQAVMLKEQWYLEFDNLARDGRAASKSRYELCRC